MHNGLLDLYCYTEGEFELTTNEIRGILIVICLWICCLITEIFLSYHFMYKLFTISDSGLIVKYLTLTLGLLGDIILDSPFGERD